MGVLGRGKLEKGQLSLLLRYDRLTINCAYFDAGEGFVLSNLG